MSLTVLSIIPLLLLIGWIVAELRGGKLIRVLFGMGAMASIAVMAFLWGVAVESFSHAEFFEPHDSAADTARMDAAANETNTMTR
jgi:hypothetical protein